MKGELPSSPGKYPCIIKNKPGLTILWKHQERDYLMGLAFYADDTETLDYVGKKVKESPMFI